MITKVTALATGLRTAYNKRYTINRLPPEVLSHIFELTTDPFQPLARDIGAVTYPSQSLIGVCGYWRDVAYRTPAVWSCVWLQRRGREDVAQSYFPRICLERSGALPLTVRMSSIFPRDDPTFIDTMSQIARMRDLRMQDTETIRFIAVASDEADAPLLQTLAIQFPYLDGVAPPLPWRVPNVENLLVEGFTSWITHPWNRLRCLCVGGFEVDDPNVVRQFLDVLVAVGPTLEDFVFFNCYLTNPVYYELAGFCTRIEMPSLQRIVEKGVNVRMLEILASRFVLPDTCCQQLSEVSGAVYGSNLTSLCHQLPCSIPERLFVRNHETVGVRGSSAFYIGDHSVLRPTLFTALVIPLQEVTELWLCVTEGNIDCKFDGLGNVRKLVITEAQHRHIPLHLFSVGWLLNFPQLLDLHIQEHGSLSDAELDWLLASLGARRDAGITIPNLAIFITPTIGNEGLTDVSDRWQDWAGRCSRERLPVQIDLLMHEDSRSTGVLRMDVPENCKASPRQAFWNTNYFNSEA